MWQARLLCALALFVAVASATQCNDEAREAYYTSETPRRFFQVGNDKMWCFNYTNEENCTRAGVVNLEGQLERCRWWTDPSSGSTSCVIKGIDLEFSVRASETRYGNIPHRADELPYDPPAADLNPAIGFRLVNAPYQATAKYLIPVWSSWVIGPPQPALISLDGTFAVHWTPQAGQPAYPFDIMVAYKYSGTCGFGEAFGFIKIHVWDEASIAAYNIKYQCHLSDPTDVCIDGSQIESQRPFKVQQVLPRIWSHITKWRVEGDNPPVPCYSQPQETAYFRFDNNSLIIEGSGRQGWGGQRVWSFGPMKGPINLLHDENLIEPTVTFNKTCAAAVAEAQRQIYNDCGQCNVRGIWGKVFSSVSEDPVQTASNVCSLFNHEHLCENAPLLTVNQGKLKYQDGEETSFDEPWITWIAGGCQRGVRGTFPWDLMRRYARNHRVSRTHLPDTESFADTPSNWPMKNVFNFEWPVGNKALNVGTSNIVITFSFYNSAIQPFALINYGRSFIDINNRYDVRLNVRQCLKFTFESGQDVFSVDFQWFRYRSEGAKLPDETCKPFALGVNLIVYPEAYDAYHTCTIPRTETIHGMTKTFCDRSPKAITGVEIYSSPNTVDKAGIPRDGDGNQIWWEDEHSGSDYVNDVFDCTDPSGSCGWQNVTLRYKRNCFDGSIEHNYWTERVTLQFTLAGLERPTFQFAPGFVESAKSINGAFTGCSGLCRTVPWDLEALRGETVSTLTSRAGQAGHQWASHEYCAQFGKDAWQPNDNDGTPWTTACGWDARTGAQGCMVKQTHDSVTEPSECVPAISVTCEEPNAITYGPTDRVIFVYDIFNVNPGYVEPVYVRVEWGKSMQYGMDSTATDQKVWLFHEDGQAAANDGSAAWVDPDFSFMNMTILTHRERNLGLLSTALTQGGHVWDFGFQMSPGLLNENMKIRIYTKLRVRITESPISDTTAPYRQPPAGDSKTKRRFSSLQGSGANATNGYEDCWVPEESDQGAGNKKNRRMMSLAASTQKSTLEGYDEFYFDPNFNTRSSAQAAAQRINTVYVSGAVSQKGEGSVNLAAISGIIIGTVAALLLVGGVVLVVAVRKGAFQLGAANKATKVSSFSDAVGRSQQE